ncbi:hypothetical protein F4604DRAFT_782267 [Suillus subluteus]|nr:hypothetical protein F4604DRAFT_782267 [Suillus subluteus]
MTPAPTFDANTNSLAVTVPSDDSTPTSSLVTPTNHDSDAASLSVKKELLVVPAPAKKTHQPSVKPMRIGTKVTPRNLCALDWQSNGHQKEPASVFATYWNGLSNTDKELCPFYIDISYLLTTTTTTITGIQTQRLYSSTRLDPPKGTAPVTTQTRSDGWRAQVRDGGRGQCGMAGAGAAIPNHSYL